MDASRLKLVKYKPGVPGRHLSPFSSTYRGKALAVKNAWIINDKRFFFAECSICAFLNYSSVILSILSYAWNGQLLRSTFHAFDCFEKNLIFDSLSNWRTSIKFKSKTFISKEVRHKVQWTLLSSTERKRRNKPNKWSIK